MAENRYDISYEHGSLVLKEYKTIRKISLNNLAKKIIKEKKEFITPFLPDNCFMYRQNEKNVEYLIKIPKGTYNMKYSERRGVQDAKTYVLTMPLQILYFKFTSDVAVQPTTTKLIWVYDDKNINLDKKMFYRPAISNIYNNSSICMGTIAEAKTQYMFINNFILAYFENVFNDDLIDGKMKIPIISARQEKLFKPGETNYEDILCSVWNSADNPGRYTTPYLFSALIDEDW